MRCIEKSLKKKCGVAVCAFFLILLLGGWLPLPKILVYNRSASLPVGWYLIVPTQQLHVGDIVVFKAPSQAEALAIERGWLPKGDLMLKQIGALAGMSYRIQDDGQFYVGDAYWGQALEVDRQDRPMPQLRGSFTVESGNFLPVSHHPTSFDGRYYGTVPLANIRCKVVPVLTGW